MTPNDIEILIHCHVSGSKHPRLEAPAVKESILAFLNDGMISELDEIGFYGTTDKGKAHIAQLCSLPLPKLQFVRFDGVVLNV